MGLIEEVSTNKPTSGFQRGSTPVAEPLSILHLLAPAPYGGLERVVEALAAGQARAGHRVRVVAVMSRGAGDHPIFSALRAAGVEVHPVLLAPRAYLSERRILSGLVREMRPSIVHTHGYRSDVVALGVRHARRVSTIHGFTGNGLRNRLYERLQLLALRRFDAVVAVARAQVAALVRAGIAPARIEVIPNAWEGGSPLTREEARARLGIDAGATVAGWVGRLSREKGPDVLVEAARRLVDLPVEFAVVGDGPERRGLEARAGRDASSRRFHWPGAVAGAADLFAAFDVFVLSSRTEGTPIVLFEAMRAGVPIVATCVGGVADVVSPETAILVQPDSPAAIADGIRRVLEDPESARARAAGAIRVLESRFSTGPWLERYERTYRRICGDPAAHAAALT